MDSVFINYFGNKKTYTTKGAKRTSYEDIPNLRADVIFEELLQNKSFIAEANEAKKNLLRNPKKFLSLSSKYEKYIKK